MTDLESANRLTDEMALAVGSGDKDAAHEANRQVMQAIAEDLCEVSALWSRVGFPDYAIAAVAQSFASTLLGMLTPDRRGTADAIIEHTTAIGIVARRPES